MGFYVARRPRRFLISPLAVLRPTRAASAACQKFSDGMVNVVWLGSPSVAAVEEIAVIPYATFEIAARTLSLKADSVMPADTQRARSCTGRTMDEPRKNSARSLRAGL